MAHDHVYTNEKVEFKTDMKLIKFIGWFWFVYGV
jgi:hypothetical protein